MNLRQRSLAISRIKAGLHARFWLPIAEMLDPNHRMATPGGAGLNFYSRGREVLRLQPDEMIESLALMKRHLGMPRLTFNMWFQLRPIYQNLLSEALTKVDMDLVACAVREYVRLTLGQQTEPGYGLIDSFAIKQDGLQDDPWNDDDDDRLRFLEENDTDPQWSHHDWKVFLATTAFEELFHHPDKFVKEFPRSAEHRLNMEHALHPIFHRPWTTDQSVKKDVLPYVKALLAIDFREAGLALMPYKASPLDVPQGQPSPETELADA